MMLLPVPSFMEEKEGFFQINEKTRIVMMEGLSSFDPDNIALLNREITRRTNYELSVIWHELGEIERNQIVLCIKKESPFDGDYCLEITENNVFLYSTEEEGIFHGIQTIRQLVRHYGGMLPCVNIKDNPQYKVRGFYHDIGRGKVPKIEQLMELVDELAFYKINQLHLYFEHAFAFSTHREVWENGVDPLTPEEILKLDSYCRKMYVELIPSLATFGHLYHALRTKSFQHLCELPDMGEMPFSFYDRMRHHTLDVSNPDSFLFVKNMIDEVVPLFTSNKINIGCDETFDLGKGKSKDLVQQAGKDNTYFAFLTQIIDYVKSIGKQPMFWGDIATEYPELLSAIPPEAICLNWEYAPNYEEDKFRIVSENGLIQYICPAVAGWNRLVNDMDSSSRNLRNMVKTGEKYCAEGVLNTNWGDFGTINMLACSIPGMALGASLSWNASGTPKDDTFDQTLSVLEYGDPTAKLVGLLRELSNCGLCHWAHLIFWYEYRTLKINEDRYLETQKEIMDYSSEALHDAIDRAQQIGSIMHEYGNVVFPEKKQDIRAFHLASEGIVLWNSFALILKEKEFGQKSHLFYDSLTLAHELSMWKDRYCAYWREHNKESELYRICEVMDYMESYLKG